MKYPGPWGFSVWGYMDIGEDELPTPYCNVAEAESLLDELFLTEDRQAWIGATQGDKQTALSLSTRDIDQLAFAGKKNDPAQERKFPRGTDTVTPAAILEACVMIAVERLDGKRPGEEVENQGLTSTGYGSVRVNYDRTSNPEHISAGIVSFEAWQKLKPFLRITGSPKQSRV